MQVLQALGRALQRFVSAWARWVSSRKTLAGKATAVAISLFALCCGFSVITAPFRSSQPATSAPGIAAAPGQASATSRPTSLASVTPEPTRALLADAPKPTKTPEPPTATAEPPTALPATSVPPMVAPPTAEPPAVASAPQANDPGLAAPPGGGGGNSENAFTCIGGCAEPPDLSCAIKGNVNSEGERIYHLPGGSFYNRTDIKPEEGDAWFCTAAEARAAGFRASER